MKVFCFIPNEFKGFRDLERFSNEVSKAWSKKGEFFPMYDIDTCEIFECGFNAEYGSIVAYGSVSIEQFREKLETAAQELIQARVQIAIAEASEEASRIYSSIAYAEKLYMFKQC